MQNYFSVLELPTTFDLDLAALEKQYFLAQRKFHPDRLTGKTSQEKQQSILQSMLVNEAFEALKFPLTRARHLLALEGIRVGSEQDSVKPSQPLLMEIMEIREGLSEARSPEALEIIRAHNAKDREKTIAQLSSAFKEKDWQNAAEFTIRLGYLEKIAEEIRGKEKLFRVV